MLRRVRTPELPLASHRSVASAAPSEGVAGAVETAAPATPTTVTCGPDAAAGAASFVNLTLVPVTQMSPIGGGGGVGVGVVGVVAAGIAAGNGCWPGRPVLRAEATH